MSSTPALPPQGVSRADETQSGLEEARVQRCACMHPRTLPSAWHTVGAQEMLNGEWINDRCSINVE